MFFCWLNMIVKYLILLGFFFVVLLILVSVICNNRHIILVVFFNRTLLTLQFCIFVRASCTEVASTFYFFFAPIGGAYFLFFSLVWFTFSFLRQRRHCDQHHDQSQHNGKYSFLHKKPSLAFCFASFFSKDIIPLCI